MLLQHSPSTKKQPGRNTGKVILAGAGPGDPDLITVKAADALRKADVVLTDRLVSEVILHRYVPATAEIVYVGKECSKKRSVPQKTINELLVHYALQGKGVVRLKGGDASIFSNILDELQTLTEHAISYEIIPGVTAALGAAACAGMPLTARGYATAVRFLTYYKSDMVTDAYWKELAGTEDTLVFYMSSGTLDQAVQKLIQFRISKEKHLAVIEQATTCFQQVHTCSLYDYATTLKGITFASPSLVVIGKVVALHQQFKWLANSHNRQLYFKPVTEEMINVHQQNNLKHAI
ncbi:uroporphyrinogen-III C-methyltransferase [Niabella ginsenosidivorans]|uniref:uroporphyrinogen-III C-methyltransferase n=1 Tax=Niabella ginsenosidivorans TaxID=1176587 RepID=A0A1A9I629_9BACT|nr:uroporphyrinogen-III C-methyltransferase [Niabella ginsenosidivorans]ANH82795.1 uroporphyrinogen-III C-methyltransferase [Niabella ginsenosidivorans]